MLISALLSQKLRDSFGDEAADEMVDWMQRIDSERSHLRELNVANLARHEAVLGERFAEQRLEARAEFAAFREEMRAQFATFREEMRAEFAALRLEMRAGFAKAHDETAQLEARFERRFNDMMRWSLLFWVSSLATVVALLKFR
ncbi:MAG TPA: hypothetical protein VHE78_14915 [Gemmatimonadaceae bacterium]|nr:hypothetical protein [Gemmatimonadaceae bacterium]